MIRPLKGLDTNLYENLESTFTQEYPNYEIFLAVANEHDQALGVVRDLIAKYPNVNAHVIIGTLNIFSVDGIRCQSLLHYRGRSCRSQPESKQSDARIQTSRTRHPLGP